jgi:hypothetical protein
MDTFHKTATYLFVDNFTRCNVGIRPLINLERPKGVPAKHVAAKCLLQI